MRKKWISVLLLIGMLCSMVYTASFAEESNSGYTAEQRRAIFCSSEQDGNECEHAIDGDLSTRWSSQGDGEWLEFVLEKDSVIDRIGIAFNKAKERIYPFEVLVSRDGENFTQVYAGQNSLGTNAVEVYSFAPVTASYVRIVCHGNSVNDWSNITEVTELPLRTVPIGICYDGAKRFFDTKPIMQNDRVLIPLRGFFEMTGYAVDWEEETQGIAVTGADTEIALRVDSVDAVVNGENQVLDQAPVLVEDTAMIPVRFVCEALGLTVDWDEENEAVILTSKEYQNKYGLAEKDDYYSEALDGKKVIFIGNSMIYYGQTVLHQETSVLNQEPRTEDEGYFYQLCRLHGVDVSVTNWTFDGHSLTDLFGGSCAANRGCDGTDHASYLTDRNYDYVIISEKSVEAPNFVKNCKDIMNLFREVNPNTQFVYLCTHRSHILNRTEVLNNLKTLHEEGFTIVDWGKVVYDIMNGNVEVPNAAQTYNQNSFVIRKSETDGSHENLLGGYITSLATYCALTGTPAQGQPYWFCNDKAINDAFDFKTFIKNNYSYGDATTNFDAIFASPADMDGIQQVIDQTLAEEAWRNYGE